MVKEIQNLLEEIGFTRQEARAYIALYKLKEARAGEISRKSGIATANLYPVLEALIQKGLISFRLMNNIKTFYSVSNEVFNEVIKKKKEELDLQGREIHNAFLNLKSSEEEIDKRINYKYFEGLSGIKSLWNEVLDYMNKFGKESILKVYGVPKEKVENLRGFYDEFHKKRIKLGQKYQLITTKEDEKLISIRKKQNSEVKIMDLKGEAGLGLFEDYFFITCQTGQKPYGFLVKDQKVSKTFNQMFNQLWKQARN